MCFECRQAVATYCIQFQAVEYHYTFPLIFEFFADIFIRSQDYILLISADQVSQKFKLQLKDS